MNTKNNQKQLPEIEPTENGPYRVGSLEDLKNSKSEELPTRETMYLCRCGGSAKKPFCDGTHAKIGFSSRKLTDGSKDKRDIYKGENITIHDNRGICAHSGRCTDGLPQAFKLKTEPWIDPNGATTEEVIGTIKECPSGALSYSISDVEHRDQERPPSIFVSKNGPYHVTGSIRLKEEHRAEGASTEHYTLCRCGGSQNKPFCDGTHWYIKFKDDNN